MTRYPESPALAVGVVVLRTRAGRREVLLIKRGKQPRKGTWSIPGGRQQLGESLAEAARREVREETSVEIGEPVLLDAVDSITRDASGRVEYHYSLVDFTAEWKSGEARAGSDAAEARWVAVESLAPYDLWRETERVIALATEKSGA